MPYICNHCHCTFDDPARVDDSVDHAFGTERRYRDVCPHCGDDDIELGEHCRNFHCSNPRHSHEILCAECRKALYQRFCNFFDTLTAEEEKQVDEWLDGVSVTDRKNWEVAHDSSV